MALGSPNLPGRLGLLGGGSVEQMSGDLEVNSQQTTLALLINFLSWRVGIKNSSNAEFPSWCSRNKSE